MEKLRSLLQRGHKPHTGPPTSHPQNQSFNASAAVASPPPRWQPPEKALLPPTETTTIFYDNKKLNSFSLQSSKGVKSKDNFYIGHVNYPEKMLLESPEGIYDPTKNKILYANEIYLYWDKFGKISALEINGNKNFVKDVRVINKGDMHTPNEVLLEFENESNSIVIQPNMCRVRSIQMSYPRGAKNLNDYTREELFGQNGIFTDERKNYDKLMSNIFRIHLGERYRIRNQLTPENICIQNNPENNLAKFQINDLPGKKQIFRDRTDLTGDRTYNECIYYLPVETYRSIRESYEATIAILTKLGIYNWTHSEFLKDELVPQIENWYTENRIFDWMKKIRINEAGESNFSEIKEFLTQVDPTPLLKEITHTLKTLTSHTKTANAIEKYLSDNSQKENAVLLMGIIGFLVSAKKATDKERYDANRKSLLERIQNPSLKKLISQLEEVCKFESAPMKVTLKIGRIFDEQHENSSCDKWIEVLCKASEQNGGPAGKEAAERCRKHKEENPKMYKSMEQIFQAIQNLNQEEALENLYDYFQVPRNEDAQLAVK